MEHGSIWLLCNTQALRIDSAKTLTSNTMNHVTSFYGYAVEGTHNHPLPWSGRSYLLFHAWDHTELQTSVFDRKSLEGSTHQNPAEKLSLQHPHPPVPTQSGSQDRTHTNKTGSPNARTFQSIQSPQHPNCSSPYAQFMAPSWQASFSFPQQTHSWCTDVIQSQTHLTANDEIWVTWSMGASGKAAWVLNRRAFLFKRWSGRKRALVVDLPCKDKALG